MQITYHMPLEVMRAKNEEIIKELCMKKAKAMRELDGSRACADRYDQAEELLRFHLAIRTRFLPEGELVEFTDQQFFTTE